MSNFGTLSSTATASPADTDRHEGVFTSAAWTSVPSFASGFGTIPSMTWTVDRAGTYFVVSSVDCQTKSDGAGGSAGGALLTVVALNGTSFGSVGYTQQIWGNNNFPPANSRRTIPIVGITAAAVGDVIATRACYVGGSAANNTIQSGSRMVVFQVGA